MGDFCGEVFGCVFLSLLPTPALVETLVYLVWFLLSLLSTWLSVGTGPAYLGQRVELVLGSPLSSHYQSGDGARVFDRLLV